MLFVLSILVDGFRVQSRGDHGWPPLACDILLRSPDIGGGWAVVGPKWSRMDQTIRLRSFHFLFKGGWAVIGPKWSHMDQTITLRSFHFLFKGGWAVVGPKWSRMDPTIRLRSSHVGVPGCLRLIGYSFEKCFQCLLV